MQFLYYKLESKNKKSSKFEEVMVQNQKKMSDLKWNASTLCTGEVKNYYHEIKI
jgi:hypothetical protein